MKARHMGGSGNTFVLIDYIEEIKAGSIISKGNTREMDSLNITIGANYIRKIGFKPDGFLFVIPSDDGIFRMLYYDVNRTTGGLSRANICGNGLRCFGRYIDDTYGIIGHQWDQRVLDVLTDDGLKRLSVGMKDVEANMGPAREYADLEGTLGEFFFSEISHLYPNPNEVETTLHFVNTGLAHIVYIIPSLDVETLMGEWRRIGRATRYDQNLMTYLNHPEGLHVNFVEINGKREISIVTYEVGVEDITKACGTGSTASAFVANKVKGICYPIKVHNPGGDLEVDMRGEDLFLNGPTEYIGMNNNINLEELMR